MKKIVNIFFAIAFVFCVSISLMGCFFVEFDTYESGYFIYQVKRETSEVYIIGLTDLGKEQEYLIIPEKINGKKVSYLSIMTFDIYRTRKKYNLDDINFKSEKLKKMFIIYDIEMISNWYGDVPYSSTEIDVFYISNGSADTYDYYRTSKMGTKNWYGRTAANVSFYYNYEDAPNDGYYWIDNYEYGERIEYIPPQPKRDGYTFDGWYKESECINAWNFEVDTLPSVNDGYTYEETKLYAKWIKK